MYISTKDSSLKKKNKSLNGVITMIQSSLSAPKGYSIIYEQFFEVITKAIAIQMRLIDAPESQESLPKYTKYLEAKINAFLHSIVPIHSSDNQRLFPSPSRIHVKGKGKLENPAFTHILIQSFNRKTVNKPEKRLKTSSSTDRSLNHTPSKLTLSKPLINANENKVSAQSDLKRAEELKMYFKVTHPMIKVKPYNTHSSSMQDSWSSSSLVNKSKSILKKFCPSCSQGKKHANVTFKEEANPSNGRD